MKFKFLILLFFFNYFLFAELKIPDIIPEIEQFEDSNYSISYTVFNKKENHETILFFYGFDGNINMVSFLARELPQYSILVIDYPGHGYSPANKNFDINKFSKTIINLLENLKIDRINLVGYSFGGIAALDFYEKYSIHIKKFILLHASSSFCRNKTDLLFYNNFKKMLSSNFNFTINYLTIPLLRDSHFTNDMLKKARTYSIKNDKESVIANFNEIISKNYDDILSGINCPVLIIGSTIDFLVKKEVSKKMAESIKDSTLYISKDFGHLSIVSSSKKIAGLISDFIEKN